jgi:hypothetical protein
MSMPGNFILVGGAVLALAPRSPGRHILASLAPKATDTIGLDMVDTISRAIYYCAFVVMCSILEGLF